SVGGVRPKDPKQALGSLHRPWREAAARKMIDEPKERRPWESGREYLRLRARDFERHIFGVRKRTASLTALIDAGDTQVDLEKIAEKDPDTGIRAMAVRAMIARGLDARPFLAATFPAEVRREVIASLRTPFDVPRLLQLLDDPDPFIRSAAVN